jgi:hypothetical protein
VLSCSRAELSHFAVSASDRKLCCFSAPENDVRNSWRDLRVVHRCKPRLAFLYIPIPCRIRPWAIMRTELEPATAAVARIGGSASLLRLN